MFSINKKVGYSYIDKDMKLSYTACVCDMQDTCTFHSESVGRGTFTLLSENRAWFVNYWHIFFHERPRLSEEYTINTWPNYFKRIQGNRNFTICDKNGKSYVEAEAVWVYMDTKRLMPTDISQAEIDAFKLSNPLDLGPLNRKVKYPKDKLNLWLKIPVLNDYLDSNNHMNNSEYLRLAFNALPLDFNLYEVRCEYKAPAKKGDDLFIQTAKTEDSFYVVITNKENTPYFICELKEKTNV